MTGDHKRLEPRRDTNMAETNFPAKILKPVTSRENTLLQKQNFSNDCRFFIPLISQLVIKASFDDRNVDALKDICTEPIHEG